jgi:hypothetical protein
MLAQQAGKCIVEKDCSPVFPEKNQKNSTKKKSDILNKSA